MEKLDAAIFVKIPYDKRQITSLFVSFFTLHWLKQFLIFYLTKKTQISTVNNTYY